MQLRRTLKFAAVFAVICLGCLTPGWGDTAPTTPATDAPPVVAPATPTPAVTAPVLPAPPSPALVPATASAGVKSPAAPAIFGRDLFTGAKSLFEINDDSPVPPDYVLGNGDKLSVVCWRGSTEYEHADVTLSPNGDIYLKLIGNVPLAQKTLAQAESELRRRYAHFYKGFDLQVQVVGRRAISVFVMGEVAAPNKYQLSSLATVFTALYAAGGPTEIGSLRAIKLVRNRKVLREIDVYDYLLNGEMVDLPLQAGDTVLVPLAGRKVVVTGEIHRPAQYELRAEKTIADVLRVAGGATATGAGRIRLSRIGANFERQVDDYTLANDGGKPVQDGDEIFVYPVLPYVKNAVTLAGAVNRPGDYPIEKVPTVSALLALAEGTTPEAYLEQAIIERRQENSFYIKIPVNLRAILDRQPDADVPLQPRDVLTVYKRSDLPDTLDRVSVEGEVMQPGSYPFKAGMTIADLVHLAFGPTIRAYLSQAHLARYPLNNRPQMVTVNLEKVLAGDKTENLELQARDVLKVYSRTQMVDLLDMVRIEGEVMKPGGYYFQAGMRMTDLVQRAFGVTTEAYLQQVFIYRYSVGQEAQMLAVDLAKAQAGDKTQDIVLQPRDRVVIKSREEVTDLAVQIDGEVVKPGTMKYFAGMKVSDALFLAGGLKPDVFMDRALLIRLNEKTYAEELAEISLRGVLAHDPVQDVVLRNKDRLIVYPISQMGEQRVVTIEGAVVAGGEFPFTGNMRVSHLLFLAKGLKQNAYSDRADLYRLRSDNTIEIIPVNLLTVQNGVTDADNPLLQPRDRLVVSTREEMQEAKQVKIDGYVRKPGTFDLSVGMKLSDLLHLAGGVKPDADMKLDIYRLVNDQVTTIACALKEVNGALVPDTDFVLKNNDLVSVRGNTEFVKITETVSIDGEVKHPGVYPAYNGTRQAPKKLYELIMEAGDTMDSAYPTGIVLYRQQTAIHTDRQQKELMRALSDLDIQVGIPSRPQPASVPAAPPVPASTVTPTASGAPPAEASTATPAVPAPITNAEQIAQKQNVTNISRALASVLTTDQGNTVVLVVPPRSMQEQQFSLSIPIDAEPVIASRGKQGNFNLEPGDYVYVPKRPTTITVLGGVVNNGSVVYQPGKTLSGYLNAVGGISTDGESKRIVVMRMNGMVLPYKQVKEIRPGDIIIVPTKYMLKVIHTKGVFERSLQTLSQLALTYLPFSK